METFAFWWQKIRRKNMSLASCSLARLCKCHAPYLPGKNRQVDWKPFFYAWNWENSHQQHLQLTTLTKFILIPPPSLSSAPQKRRFFEWASHLLKLSRGLTFKQLFKRRMSSIGCETQQLQSIACAQTLGKARGTTGDLTQTIPTPKI